MATLNYGGKRRDGDKKMFLSLLFLERWMLEKLRLGWGGENSIFFVLWLLWRWWWRRWWNVLCCLGLWCHAIFVYIPSLLSFLLCFLIEIEVDEREEEVVFILDSIEHGCGCALLKKYKKLFGGDGGIATATLCLTTFHLNFLFFHFPWKSERREKVIYVYSPRTTGMEGRMWYDAVFFSKIVSAEVTCTIFLLSFCCCRVTIK